MHSRKQTSASEASTRRPHRIKCSFGYSVLAVLYDRLTASANDVDEDGAVGGAEINKNSWRAFVDTRYIHNDLYRLGNWDRACHFD